MRLTLVIVIIILFGYTIIGTDSRVDEIKVKAPLDIPNRNWEIVRYESFQYGSWYNHGGKVWYHVKNIDNENIQYRVYVTIWDGELQYTYGEPEILQRFEVDFKPKE